MNTAILPALLLSSLFLPTWHGNYSQAQIEAASQKKPLLVVFGTGPNGWSKVIRDQAPNADVTKLLQKDYVCVYMDTDQADGKRWADTFEMNGKLGMVISDRALSTQAFWHQGDMTHENMLHYLRKYASSDVVVRGTETATNSRVSYYPSQGMQPQQAFQGFAQPGYGQPTFAQPMRAANC